MKVLLIGEVYSYNLGDPLLCETVEYLICDQYPEAEIIKFDMSGKVNAEEWWGKNGEPLSLRSKLDKIWLYAQVYTNRKLCHEFSIDTTRYISMWCSLCEVLRNHHFDVAVFAGGSLFMDYFAAAVYLIVKRLSEEKVKTIFHACGMSMLDEDHQYLLNKALQKSNVVSVALRDGYDRFVSTFFIHTNVVETYDTALNCSLFYPAAEEKLAEYGVGLIDNSTFFEEQVKLIRLFLQSKLDWKVFTNGAYYDEAVARRVLLTAGIQEKELDSYIVKKPTSAAELIKTVTQFSRIVSFRMHSQIAAASYGIPCYGIAWDEKIPAFFSKLGFPENVGDSVNTIQDIQNALHSCEDTIRAKAQKQAQKSRDHLYDGIQIAMKNG